jgi:hypothetical protein
MFDRAGLIAGEFQAPGIAIVTNQVLEPRFMDRDLAAIELLDARRVDIDANDVVTRIRETGTRNQPDIARAKDRDFHG